MRRIDRWAGLVVPLSVLLFSVLVGAAMSAYPGGHAWDRGAPGHDFWRNYLCDLQRVRAYSGAPNPVSSWLTRVAMVTLSIGFLAHFWAVTRDAWWVTRALGAAGTGPLGARPPALGRGRGRWVWALGVVSATSCGVVGLLPNDAYDLVHNLAIALGTLTGFTAVALTFPALRRAGARWLVGVGWILVAVASVDFVLYVDHLIRPGPGTPWIPALERISLLLVLTFLLMAHGPSGGAPRPPGGGQ